MIYRNRKLLDLAHSLPCMAQFPHNCTQYEGVEPAHSDQQLHGRGVGHKTADWCIAAMCHTAHMALDSKELAGLKTIEWNRAHVATMNYFWENGLIIVK